MLQVPRKYANKYIPPQLFDDIMIPEKKMLKNKKAKHII
jgi:hypothetical protein